MTRAWRCSGIHASAVSLRRTPRGRRCFTASARRGEVRDLVELEPRLCATFRQTGKEELLALHWPSHPPRNILFVRKDGDARVDASLVEYATHIKTTYPSTSLIFEPSVAHQIHHALSFPIYTLSNGAGNALYTEKVDLTTTLGGDGTILHAASLFATASSVPPILSFSMGTLGFLGEWKFAEYKRAFREVFMSGSPAPAQLALQDAQSPAVTATATDNDSSSPPSSSGWAALRGKSLGSSRHSRILMRNRLSIGLFHSATGQRLPHDPPATKTTSATSQAHPSSNSQPPSSKDGDIFALNEVLLHRGALPHLAHLTILIGSPPYQRPLTTAIADGFLVSTPTGSTAYSLSSGGSIVHPLVASLLLTPICPRSLSFRPLVLPANTQVTLRIEEGGGNRGKEIEVSVDGVRRERGLGPGMEVRVVGEEVVREGGTWTGGVPMVVRSGGGGGGSGAEGEDPWVGGLNGLLKFNYPFGEDG